MMFYRLIEMRYQGLYDGSGTTGQKSVAPRHRGSAARRVRPALRLLLSVESPLKGKRCHFAGDQTRAAAIGDPGPYPIQEDRCPVAKTDQEKYMDNAPDNPGQ